MISSKVRELHLGTIKQLSPVGKRMFNILREHGELSTKEWARHLGERAKLNGNERRQLEFMLGWELILIEKRMVEYERMIEPGWNDDEWRGAGSELTNRGRYFVYTINPEALEALQPPTPAATKPQVEPARMEGQTTWQTTLPIKEPGIVERAIYRAVGIGLNIWDKLGTP